MPTATTADNTSSTDTAAARAALGVGDEAFWREK